MIKVKHFIVILIVVLIPIIIPLHYYYTEVKKPEFSFYDMYATIKIEYVGDKEIYKYSNSQGRLIRTLDFYKEKSMKSDKTVDDEWIYRITLGYSPFTENEEEDQTTEILFKSHSMTIDGFEYIRKDDKEYQNMLDTIKFYYESDMFTIYKK